MRTVFGHNPHIARRIIWLLILIICFSIAVVQVQIDCISSPSIVLISRRNSKSKVQDRVAYFISTPVRVNVRTVINDSQIRFPVISLCNKNLFNLTAMSILKKEKAAELLTNYNLSVTQSTIDRWDIPDLIGVRGYDATQVWDFTAHSIKKMSVEVSSLHRLSLPLQLIKIATTVFYGKKRQLCGSRRMEKNLQLHGRLLLLSFG